MTTHPTAAGPVDTDRGSRAAGPRPVRRLLAATATAALAVAVLAGCAGGAAGPDAAGGTPSSTTPPPSATPPPSGTAAGTTAPAGGLLWPVTDAAAAKALQAQVDNGAQPWLLDPAEVATSYATTVLGWRAPTAGAPDSGSVVVTDPDAGSTTVTMVQPATTGAAGIWVVTAARRN
ncbi:hypothetical protein [Pseudonocardia dioxanivorans]|uniref:hypothetical protein n=1 Tax=Pseudonocardia dioxanivorans TaxID=240495 RepID=UPI000CD15443|nr:hypothetical protein [Pseudonocardia dioxanivorans]